MSLKINDNVQHNSSPVLHPSSTTITKKKIITYIVFLTLCIIYIVYIELTDTDDKDSNFDYIKSNYDDITVNMTEPQINGLKLFILDTINERKERKNKRDKLYSRIKTSMGITFISTTLRWNDAISITEMVLSVFIANIVIFFVDY